jgi:hypothetical protein
MDCPLLLQRTSEKLSDALIMEHSKIFATQKVQKVQKVQK